MTVLVNYDVVPPLVSASQPLAGRLPSDPTTPSARLALRLQRAYIERVQEYQREFEMAESENSVQRIGPEESGFPSIELLLDGVKNEFIVDETLYKSLFDLYAFYGWDGVRRAEDALRQMAHERLPDATIEVSWRFFMYTRNLLAVLIRETLIELEHRAAQIVFDRLGVVHRKLSAAMTGELAFTYRPASSEPVTTDVQETFQYLPDKYELTKKATATALYGLLTKAVERRDKYDKLVSEQSKLRKLQNEASDAVAQEGPSAGWRSPYGDDKTGERKKQVDAELHQIAGLVEAALGELQIALKDVFAKSPFALIAAPGLAAGFSQAQMEDALGRMLTQVDEGVDAIASATRPGESRVARHMAGLPSNWQNDTTGSRRLDPRTVERLYLPHLNLEFELAERAAKDANRDPAISWLLEPRSWQLVMAGGSVEPGSFEHIVLFHWSRALSTFESDSAKARFGFSRKLALASAAVSLISIVLWPLRSLDAVLTLAVLIDGAFSAARRLADMDRAIAAQLPALDERGELALAELGSLLAMRPQLVGEIAGELALLLVTLGAARKIQALKVALVWNGYIDDVTTLLHASDDS